MVVQAKLISMGEKRTTAEVVSYLGERSRKRSVTSHVRRGKDGVWRGHNPNKPALAWLDAAEAKEAKQAGVMHPLEEAVNNLREEIYFLKDTRADAKAAGMDDPATEKEDRKDRRYLGEQLKQAVAARDAKSPDWEAATVAARKLRAETPREVEFVF